MTILISSLTPCLYVPKQAAAKVALHTRLPPKAAGNAAGIEAVGALPLFEIVVAFV
jgi:hypothetical protein